MLYFIGNCQADFVGRVLESRGYPVMHRTLASPLTYPSHPDAVPPTLASLVSDLGLEPYFDERPLSHQFEPIPCAGPAPELIVINLFHETTPLFIHDTEQYIYYMHPRALTDSPAAMQWAQAHCRMFQPNPASYMDRFKQMLTVVRDRFSRIPILILSRLGPYPAFGPEPYSYLKGWPDFWKQAKDRISRWSDSIPDLHHLDMDRVFAGLCAASSAPIDAHCPFLKIRLEETDGEVTALHARRDIEHVGPLPDRLADKIETFMATGTIAYTPEESVPTAWRRPWRGAVMTDASMMERLTSGANYRCAEAVASAFLDLSRDRTDLFVQAAPYMPVCHNTLHMLKQYAVIWKNPAMADWCDCHAKTAANFDGNGPLYRQHYLERIAAIRRTVLGPQK